MNFVVFFSLAKHRASWQMGGGWVAVDVDYAGCATVPPCQPLPPLTPNLRKRGRLETAPTTGVQEIKLFLTMTLFFPSISANPAAKRVDKDW